jgi:hypothetical protein
MMIIVASRYCTNHVARGLGFSMVKVEVGSMSAKEEWTKRERDPCWSWFSKVSSTKQKEDASHERLVVEKHYHVSLSCVPW